MRAMTLRGQAAESTLARELREQVRAAPALLISILFHVIMLCFLLCLPGNPPIAGYPPTTIIIVTPNDAIEEPVKDNDEEPIAPADPDFSNPANDMESERSLHGAMETLIRSVAAPMPNVVLEQINVDTVIDMPSIGMPGESADDQVDNASDSDVELIECKTLTGTMRHDPVGAGNRGGYGAVGRNLRSIVGGVAGGAAGSADGGAAGICLVWLLDQSASMKDDQETISRQAQDIQELLTDGGKRKILSGVLAYGDIVTELKRMDPSAVASAEAIANVPPNHSGRENVCMGIVQACRTMLSDRPGWTKVIVLMSDENGDDHQALVPESIAGKGKTISWQELALQELLKTRTRLYVIGKESPFQADIVHENLLGNSGEPLWIAACRGPESAVVEVPVSMTTHNYAGIATRHLSGFGVYDLAYMAKMSQGAYFILDESPEARRPLRPSQKATDAIRVDWGIMDAYKPLLVARSQYRAEVEKTPQGRTLYRVRDVVARMPDFGWGELRPPSGLAAQRANLKKRLDCLDEAIRICREGIVSDTVLRNAGNKRDIANLDLFLCALYASQIITESYYEACTCYTGPTPADATLILAPTRLQGAELTPERAARFERQMTRLRDAAADVIRRHANTPWAGMAQGCLDGPKTYAHPMTLLLKDWVKPIGETVKWVEG